MSAFYLVKDYIEVVHKLIETSPNYILQHSSYTDFLTIINFSLTTLKQFCSNLLSFEWLNKLWYFPIIIPEIATSMLEEISVVDGNFHNILTFLDKPIAVGNQIYGNYYLPATLLEKFFTGLVNSLFIWLPTSTATFLCFRRFIMQGVEAGYSAALGTMAASLFWFTSILFGLRFIVVPWMSLDLFRYWLGFLLLMKYFWDNRYAYKEVKHNSVFGKHTKRNIFGFHFLLALTEQSSLYPFLNNFSISSQSTMLESFPSENFFDFSCIHFSYLLGIAIGSYSLINLLCWFWQDPAYRFYFWIMNKFKKLRIADIVRPVHLFFQTLTVLFAFSSLPYFGMEYQIANPLGFLPNDQVFHQFKQTSFLTHSTSPAYYRSRLNFPRQKFFRYEDWAEYYHRNTPIDTSLYDQGAYRLYTMEDLSYGKDYEWMRRRSDKIKIRSRLKRLRWFPRNWANRLWEFTKTWSRRNIFWRNDILNMYQYSWDSKAPLIWGKLVFEEFFPTKLNQRNLNIAKTDGELSKNEKNYFSSAIKKPVTPTWDSFWGPDPDWSSKFLWNQTTFHNNQKDFWWNWQSRLNLSDNDIWWKWLINKSATTSISKERMFPEVQKLQSNQTKSSERNLKSDFWEPQKRFISIYSDQSNRKETMLEYSILRKFTRKLTARFKVAQIENNSTQKINVSSNSIKTLLLLPSLRDWTVFQTVMTNINQMLWWRCLLFGDSKKKVSSLSFSNSNSILALQNAEKSMNGFQKDHLYSKNAINQQNFVLSFFSKEQGQLSLESKKLYASKQKFEKLQNKYFQIQLKQNNLNSNFSTNKFSQISSLENFKNTLEDKSSFIKENSNVSASGRDELHKYVENNSLFKKDWSFEKNISSTLLHPIKYYLHKEETFKKKLSFYGVKKAGNLIINKLPEKNTNNFFTKPFNGNLASNQLLATNQIRKNPKLSYDSNILTLTNKKNNLPIFNFYLKTYFQTYKKTKLYVLNTKMKRQLGMGASARRKGRDYSNKLLKRSKILANTPWIRQWIDQSGFLARRKRLETWIARQHYDPNELWSKIMKLDVDLFMNRQPNSYFLTNTEEKLLHLRRFLLFEHYDSLRWYTFMTNYRTMKNTIGGTKSFTNKLYNQQFKGTFHKVRHLFSLTPSVSNGAILKFDQSLYNLTSHSNVQGHEELINDFSLKDTFSKDKNNKEDPLISKNMDLIEKSTQIIKQSIWQNNFLRKNYIEESLEQKNYNLLTQSVNSLEKTSPKNKIFNVTNGLQQSSSIKTNLQTKLMLSLFKKRQKWTKDYKRSSEKLWKKWKFHNILFSNKTFRETSRNPTTRDIFVQSKQNLVSTNMNLPEQKKLLTNNKIEDYANLNDYKIYLKFVQISKLKKLAGFNNNNFNFKLLEKGLTELSTQKTLDTIFANQKTIENSPLKIQPFESSIQYALKDGIKIQSNSNQLESKTFSLSTSPIFQNNLFQNNLFTRKLIKERYAKLSNAQFNSISRNLFTKFESRFNFGINKFSLNYKLKNSLNKRIRNSFSVNSLIQSKNGNNLSEAFDKELNIKLYQKNLFRRERSNIQNLIFMKKFLLNDSNLSLTRSQIRPLPGKRTKALYERGSSSLSDYYNQTLGKMDNTRGSLQSTFLFSSEAGSNLDLKIRAYKNQKWFEEADKDLNFNINLNSLKNNESQESRFNMNKLNRHWKGVLSKLKNTKLVSDQLDETLQKKFLQLQNLNVVTNALNKQNISLDTANDLTQNLQKKLILNNQFSGTISRDQNQMFQNNVRQKLTKTVLKRSLQKIVNSSTSNKNFIEAELPNVIRLTKSLRKRQQDKITRSLLKRHLNLKSRRKLFLKTKEVNNQRIAIDRHFEIQERLFNNKISYYDQFQKNLQTKDNFVEQPNLSEKNGLEQKDIVFPFENINSQFEKTEALNLALVSKQSTNHINIVNPSNPSNQAFSTLQKSSSSLFNNLLGWLNESEKQKSLDIFSAKSSDKKMLMSQINDNSYKNSDNNYVLENTKTKKEIIENFILQNKAFTTNSFKDFGFSFAQNVLSKDNYTQNQSYLSSLKRSTGLINIMLKNEQTTSQGQKNSFPEKFLSLKLKEKIKSGEFVFGSFIAGKSESISLEPEKNVLRRSMRKFFVNDYRTIKKHSKNFKNLLKNHLQHYGKDQKTLFINNLYLKNWLKEKVVNQNSNFLYNRKQSKLSEFSELKTNYSDPNSKAFIQKLTKNNFSKNELLTLNKYIISSRTNPNKLSKQQMRKKLKKRRIIRSKRIERLKVLKDHPLKFRSEQIQTFYNVQDSLDKWKNFSFKAKLQKSNFTKPLNLDKFSNSQFSSSSIKLAESFEFFKQNKLNETKNSVLSKNLSLTPLKEIYNSKLGSDSSETNNSSNSDLFYTLYKDIFLEGPSLNNIKFENNNLNFETQQSNIISKPLEATNMPFYAGWDESVRKFVLTNRLLSRREAGYEIAKNSVYPVPETVTNFESNLNKNIIFSSWPLKGKNAATTLFSQFPFLIAPQNNSNFSDEKTLILKGGTKYELPEGTIISENGFLVSKFMQNTERNQSNKWKQKLTEKINDSVEKKVGKTSDTGLLFSNQEFSKLYIKFKKQKRIKTIIKSSKNEDHVGIRQAGQVISNLATVKNRKAARRNLFSSIPWRTKKQTTKSLLKLLAKVKTEANVSSSNSFGSERLKFAKLFFSDNSKNNAIDQKLSAKLLLLRNLRNGNVSQTKLTYLRRLQKFIRPTGSAWKKNINLSRRKKQYISMNKNLLSSGFIDYFPNRFNVRKRKKRSNNKNPRLRGDKNFKKTKRQYRQKIYLRPKNRPLRRRSLGVLFQNKLNYWRLNYQNLSTNQSEKTKENVSQTNSLLTGNLNQVSTANLSTSKIQQMLHGFSLAQNSLYSLKENEWQALNRPKKLYRSLFSNNSKLNPLLYQTLPGHNRSIPIIKNLPLPGSSVKTLNRIVKWSSADGASRFYRVNLSYGWALELFLKDLHQKIRLKVPSLNSLPMNSVINDYLIKLMQINNNKFSSNRSFKRKSYKLRQLSYTMSMRLYDRWFFYYYKNLNDSLLNKEQTTILTNPLLNKNLKSVSDDLNINIENRFEPIQINRNTSIVSLFKHIKKLLTFHLTDSQINFRSYLKNLRNTAYLKQQNITLDTEEMQQDQSKSLNKNQTNLETQLKINSPSTDISQHQKTTGLDSFQLSKKNVKQKNIDDESNNYTNLVNGNGENIKQNDKNSRITPSRSLLKKEKKYAEDRFFFAQFTKPPLVDEYRLTLENNRHYPVNGGFVWPGDYLRLKTILLPKEIKDLYLNEKNKKMIKIINVGSKDFSGLKDYSVEGLKYNPIELDLKRRLT
uniref:Hypothetical chloroplast RF1 n=1 Tax=Uronema confervicola TaxID=764120 RepID=A0A6H1U6A6_9CHLO|nr:hypothetical chloroplast RF1 [Uronema confervicola]QIZ74185.1 hypothetical chloroplast RF1 [Uronema confervicola]